MICLPFGAVCVRVMQQRASLHDSERKRTASPRRDDTVDKAKECITFMENTGLTYSGKDGKYPPSGFQLFGGYGMVVAVAKGGEGMGRAAAAEVRGGWVGMVLRVQASPDHPCPRRARPSPRPPRRRRRTGGREIWWFPSTFCTNGKFSWQLSAETVANPPKGRRAGADS